LEGWLFAILERGESGRPYNVGSDKALSIRELAASVRRILGVKNEIVVKGKPDSAKLPSVYVPVIERAKYELGLELKTSIESSVRRMAGLSEREQL
jgi:dTDP-glucose 4,6-dehydratase